MGWIDSIVAKLEAEEAWSYSPGLKPASEPTALAALALLAHGRPAASRALDWLTATQISDGSVGIFRMEPTPAWPTSLAIIAWTAARQRATVDYGPASDLAVYWLLSSEGKAMPRVAEFGHDSSLIGWPWAEGTHSWVEPTAWALLALEAADRDDHPRAGLAARLLIDRLLPSGGANYGNTTVFGQELRPHLAPSGLCLAALGDRRDAVGSIDKTADYVARELPTCHGTISLCYGILGLSAIGRRPAMADEWLERAARRALDRNVGADKLSLLVLAAEARCPLRPARQAETSRTAMP